jgi:hypothetical protein
VYLGGMSRGDTPPREIRTLGAAGGRPKVSEVKLAEMNRGCPFYLDETARFSARHEGMNMDVIKKDDVPQGPVRFTKDYDRCLLTEDLELAQPTLAHPSSASGNPIPWKYFETREKVEIEKSKATTHYPPVTRRPRDLSLKTSDIELAQAKRIGFVPRQRPACIIDQLTPSYQFTSHEAEPSSEYRPSGRCALDVSDIEGACPKSLHPVRNAYGNPLKCEIEFRSRGRQASAAGKLVAGGLSALHTTSMTPRHVNDSLEERRPLRPREGHPLEPKYVVHHPTNTAATTLHVRWTAEKHIHGEQHPEVAPEEIGSVPGSKPRTEIRDNGEPQLSLATQDIAGARSQLRAGTLPYSMYGPSGKRPALSSSLNTADIVGAQASTIKHGPKIPSWHTSRQIQTGASIAGQTPRGASNENSALMLTAAD